MSERREHTPGPWVFLEGEDNISDDAGSDGVLGSIWSDGFHLARVWADIKNDDREVALANARLIAAAPDLVAALEQVYARVPDNLAQDLGWVEALLAKARGEQ